MDITDHIPPSELRRLKRRRRTRRELWTDLGLYLLISVGFLVVFVAIVLSNARPQALKWAIFALLTVGALGETVFKSRTCWQRPRFWWKVGMIAAAQVIVFALLLTLFEPYMNRALWQIGCVMDLCALVSFRRWMRR